MLSQDPYVPVSLGRLRWWLDPYMFCLLGEPPAWQGDLIARVRARQFSLILLTTPT